jgi:hypothetical protein
LATPSPNYALTATKSETTCFKRFTETTTPQST